MEGTISTENNFTKVDIVFPVKLLRHVATLNDKVLFTPLKYGLDITVIEIV